MIHLFPGTNHPSPSLPFSLLSLPLFFWGRIFDIGYDDSSVTGANLRRTSPETTPHYGVQTKHPVIRPSTPTLHTGPSLHSRSSPLDKGTAVDYYYRSNYYTHKITCSVLDKTCSPYSSCLQSELPPKNQSHDSPPLSSKPTKPLLQSLHWQRVESHYR